MVGGRWSKNTWFNPSVKTTTHISSPVHYSLLFDRFFGGFILASSNQPERFMQL